MAGQRGFFVTDGRLLWLSAAGDPLERLPLVVDLELFRPELDAALIERGCLAMGGQIVDATIVGARRSWLTQAEKDVVKGGGVPESRRDARTRQIDREGRWKLKRGKKKPVPPGSGARAAAEIVVPLFGYKNHVGIDREHGFVRRFKIIDAAARDGAQPGAVLDRPTPRARSGPAPRIARPPTSRCSRDVA